MLKESMKLARMAIALAPQGLRAGGRRLHLAGRFGGQAMAMRKTWLAWAGLAGMLALAASPAQAADLAIHAGRLIDGTGRPPREKVTILIHDDRIAGVEPGFTAPRGAAVIDLSASTVLPGLIDDHVHITQSFHKGDPIHTAMTRTAYDDEIDAVVNARNTLLAGFTSARDVGGETGVV